MVSGVVVNFRLPCTYKQNFLTLYVINIAPIDMIIACCC